jgi:peptidoglycan/xylan/chitin deacetylase (PgdA/CDA1 family)
MHDEDVIRASRLRWFLKKSARKTVALTHRAGSVCRRAQPRPSVRVLTYHRFGDSVRDPFCVRVDDFDRQMALLADLGLAVSLRQLESFLDDGTALVDGAVLITIDDGCPSFVQHALPILKRHGIPSALFVPAGELVDARAPRGPERPIDRMTWHELKEAANEGVAIGSHA